MTTWNNISKASGTGYTNIAKPATESTGTEGGSPIGLLLALTYATTTMNPIDIWTDVSKAVGTTYTNIPKAT